MDFSIEASVKAKRKRRTVWIVLGVVAALALVLVLLRLLLSPSVDRRVIATATVGRGDVENTITATGEVLPEFEEVITSPIAASVQAVLLNTGSAIKAGQSILTLDKAAAQTQLAQQQFGLESKRNSIKKLKLELDKSFYDIKSNNDVKQLRINSLEADVENAKRLYNAGGGTRESIEQAELNLKVARLEKQQLENEIRSKQQTMQVEMREAAIDAQIQESNLNELKRKLQLANIAASRAGVVTWVNKNIGASVHEGDALARIADLSSFKVQGSVSDTYLSQLRNGMPAMVRVDDTTMRGAVVNIQPSVQNGIVTFEVRLDEQAHGQLRPNMKVDVYLVTASKRNVLRVANGPAFRGPTALDVFVVQGNKAVRRTVHVGMSNFDYVELLDGVQAGEVVVTSDMTAYRNVKVLTIND